MVEIRTGTWRYQCQGCGRIMDHFTAFVHQVQCPKAEEGEVAVIIDLDNAARAEYYEDLVQKLKGDTDE